MENPVDPACPYSESRNAPTTQGAADVYHCPMGIIQPLDRLALSLVLVIGWAPATFAQAPDQRIFKCVDGEATSYQSMPCGRGKAEVQVLTIARVSDAPSGTQSVAIPRAEGPVPSAQSPGRMWPPRRVLMFGISDDEVLNLAGWGVPQHITRTKEARGWREEWTYTTANGERRLNFVNASLVDAAVDSQAALEIASNRRATYPPT